MRTLILLFELANNNWIVLIGLVAAILGIIDFFTNHKIFRYIRNLLLPNIQDVIPAKYLKMKHKFRNEVFAIELLTEDVILEKNQKGLNTIIINRNNVKQALINNAGKKQINNEHVQKNIERLKEIEIELQNFLLNVYDVKNNKFILSLNKMPLRWASGGVLSIVNYKRKKWIPMFFRDIQPYGWNISLGSTERSFFGNKPDFDKYENELNSPLNYIEREFLEETLVLTGVPEESRNCKARYFKSLTNSLDDKTLLDTQNYNDHINLRDKYDNFNIVFDRDKYIAPNLLNSNMEVQVKKNNKEWTTSNIFICFNLLELGIEVVKVIEYDLEDNDYILDGEVLEKDGIKELVRMPIALISLDYLNKEFSISNTESYTVGVAPSIKAINCIKKEDVILFDWDIKQRYRIIEGKKVGIGTELERYIDWKDKFQDYFSIDPSGEILTSNLPSIFTPATIKIFKQYNAFKK